jgi:hypothetical protein
MHAMLTRLRAWIILPLVEFDLFSPDEEIDMATLPNMDSFLGKGIDAICGNGFHTATANHCAHFVSHALEFTFSFNCRQFVGGNKTPANIRVHEIFAECPRVGRWENANAAAAQLIFVTRKDVVNIFTKTMQNIPQKHIGVYQNGFVYHYSNTDDRVVKQTVSDFFARFQAAYSGDQGLFFGEFPHSDLELSIDVTAASVSHLFAFALRKEDKKWFAKRADISAANEFFVGQEVMQPSRNFFGIFHPVPSYYGPSYNPEDHTVSIDHWAFLLDVTAFCESKLRLNLINTYDRARFTYGFYQLAAHTPRDNLILLFREALLDTDFQKLFPDLELRGGKVFRVAQDGTATDLEEEFHDPATGENQLKRFMAYLNPERTTIDEQEVLQAARVIWWANTHTASAEIQVKVANSILQRKMSQRYADWYPLDGKSDVICAIIADIHHQGRGSKAAVRAALNQTNKVKALLEIGKSNHPERVSTLTARVKKWTDAGVMGTKKYRAALNEFE